MKSRLKTFSVDLSNTVTAQEIAKSNEKRLKTRLIALKALISQTKSRQDSLTSDQETYFFMLQRLKAMQIFLDIKKNFLNSQIKNKNQVLSQVDAMRSLSNERKTRNVRAHKHLNRSLTFFHREYQKATGKIKNDLDLMEFIDENRDMRTFRQQNIIEQVGINEKNRREKAVRESLLLHKTWFLQLSKKYESSMDRFSKIDLAFKSIKSITGLDDVSLLVKKLMTKEENLHNLTQIIATNKLKIDKFSKMNSDLQKNINQISISDAGSLREIEIHSKTSTLQSISTQKAQISEKHLKLSSTFKSIKQWVLKMIILFDPDFKINNEKLFELFSILKFKLHSSLKPRQTFNSLKPLKIPLLNPVSLRKKERFSLNQDSLSLSDINHTSSSNSKSLISLLSEKKRKK
jgi:hypothetical protein